MVYGRILGFMKPDLGLSGLDRSYGFWGAVRECMKALTGILQYRRPEGKDKRKNLTVSMFNTQYTLLSTCSAKHIRSRWPCGREALHHEAVQGVGKVVGKAFKGAMDIGP